MCTLKTDALRQIPKDWCLKYNENPQDRCPSVQKIVSPEISNMYPQDMCFKLNPISTQKITLVVYLQDRGLQTNLMSSHKKYLQTSPMGTLKIGVYI